MFELVIEIDLISKSNKTFFVAVLKLKFKDNYDHSNYRKIRRVKRLNLIKSKKIFQTYRVNAPLKFHKFKRHVQIKHN